MPDIQRYLDDIKKAVYGEEVRGSIHDAIDAINRYTEQYSTKDDIDRAITEALEKAGFSTFKIVDVLPSASTADDHTLYMLKNEITQHYDIYAKINGKMEWLDDTTVDLSNYVTNDSLEHTLESYVTSESLDAKDYVTNTQLDEKHYVTESVLEAKDYVSETELESTLTAKDYATKTELSGKVDTEAGKGLSERDFTSALETKLTDIEEGAEKNAIEIVKVNGEPLVPDGERAVDVKAYNEDNKPEVGGRNLFGFDKEIGFEYNTGRTDKNINGIYITKIRQNNNGYMFRISKLGFNGIDGKYTVSGEISAKNSMSFTIDICDSKVSKSFSISSEPIRFQYTANVTKYFTPDVPNLNGFVDFNFSDWAEDETVTIKNLKVERGEIATDWSPAPEDLAPIDEQKILAQIANRTYQGTDLTVKFKSEIDGSFNGNPWAWIQDRIDNANWDGLHVCDYIPFTTVGLETNVTMQAQIGGIKTYYQYGDSPVPNHIDFITREIWPTLHTFNPVNYNNGTAAQNYPWLASDMYLWLNSLSGSVPNEATVNPETIEVDYTQDGVYYFLPDELKDVIVEKRLLLETRYNASSLLTTSPGWGWQNAGKLWLPTEMEVYGTNVWGGAGYPTGGGIQYPIFANSMNRLKYRNGSRCGWWFSTPYSGNSMNWCGVDYDGRAARHNATNTWIGAPVCFRIASTLKTADMPVESPEMMDEYMQHEMEE